jgi:hypothetical protein
VRQAAKDGVPLGWKALDMLARAAEDGALLDLAIGLRARADALKSEERRQRGGEGQRGGMAAGYSVRPGRPGEL